MNCSRNTLTLITNSWNNLDDLNKKLNLLQVNDFIEKESFYGDFYVSHIFVRANNKFFISKVKHLPALAVPRVTFCVIPMRRDLSETSISHLPSKGLKEIEILRLENTQRLKEIPSIYNFEVFFLLFPRIVECAHLFSTLYFSFAQRYPLFCFPTVLDGRISQLPLPLLRLPVPCET